MPTAFRCYGWALRVPRCHLRDCLDYGHGNGQQGCQVFHRTNAPYWSRELLGFDGGQLFSQQHCTVVSIGCWEARSLDSCGYKMKPTSLELAGCALGGRGFSKCWRALQKANKIARQPSNAP